MALSISFESHAGSGGSWDIWSGLEPSDSSIRMVTLCTEAVPVFLPNTCWLEDEKQERHIKRESFPKYHIIIDIQIKHIYNECVLLLPDGEGEVFGSMVPLHLDQVPPALSDQHEGLRVEHL